MESKLKVSKAEAKHFHDSLTTHLFYHVNPELVSDSKKNQKNSKNQLLDQIRNQHTLQSAHLDNKEWKSNAS